MDGFLAGQAREKLHKYSLTRAMTFEQTRLFSAVKDLTFTSDHNGINTGVFAVRKSEWSLTFLSLLYAQRGSVDYFNSIGKGSGFVDQQGLKILREKYYSKTELAKVTLRLTQISQKL